MHDRQSRPRQEGIYYEEHHIVPRCQNGTNEASNLVFLTADEHLLAHVVYALAHPSESSWRAAKAASTESKCRKIRPRPLLQVLSNNLHDHLCKRYNRKAIYDLVNIETKERTTGNLAQLVASTGINKESLIRLLSKEVTTVKNFSLSDTVFEEYTVSCPSGQELAGTLRHICKVSGLDISQLTRLVKGSISKLKGYTLLDRISCTSFIV